MIFRVLRFFIGGIFYAIGISIMDKRDVLDLTEGTLRGLNNGRHKQEKN